MVRTSWLYFVLLCSPEFVLQADPNKPCFPHIQMVGPLFQPSLFFPPLRCLYNMSDTQNTCFLSIWQYTVLQIFRRFSTIFSRFLKSLPLLPPLSFKLSRVVSLVRSQWSGISPLQQLTVAAVYQAFPWVYRISYFMNDKCDFQCEILNFIYNSSLVLCYIKILNVFNSSLSVYKTKIEKLSVSGTFLYLLFTFLH